MQFRASLVVAIALVASASVIPSYGFVETTVVGRGDALSFGMTATGSMAVASVVTNHKNLRTKMPFRLQSRRNDDDETELGGQTTPAATTQHQRDHRLATLLAASTVFAAATALDPTGSVARAAYSDLGLVSPGTTTIEADSAKIIQSTETTLNGLAKTALYDSKNRGQLADSVGRIQKALATEFTSVEAWKEITKILRDYGVDLKTATNVSVRPPADWKTSYDDLVQNKKVSLLVNGEIVQIQLVHQTHVNTKDDEGKVVQPDDEWVFSVKGYKGYDPNAIATKKGMPQPTYYEPPLKLPGTILGQKTRDVTAEASALLGLSYATSYAYYVDLNKKAEAEAAAKREAAAKKKKEAAAKKKAVAKAKQEEEGKNTRKKAPKPKRKEVPKQKPPTPPPKEPEAVAATKPSPAPPSPSPEKKTNEPLPEETTTTKPAAKVDANTSSTAAGAATTATVAPSTIQATDASPTKAPAKTPATKPKAKDKINVATDDEQGEDDDDVKVTIDFDKDGKVIITATDSSKTSKRRALVAFSQALVLPWLGFLASSSPSTDDRSHVVKFAQALLFPWSGIFFPKGGRRRRR